MFARPFHPQQENHGRIRPASHSYLVQREPFAVTIIGGLGAVLIYAGVWLIRLLG